MFYVHDRPSKMKFEAYVFSSGIKHPFEFLAKIGTLFSPPRTLTRLQTADAADAAVPSGP